MTRNLFHDNTLPFDENANPGCMDGLREDIFIEVSHGPTLMDHNICLSKLSFKLASQGCAVVHNLCLGPMSSIGSGSDMPLSNGTMAPRYTPYHIRHRTEVAGMMTFLHGDDRIYNNIFIQNWPVRPEEIKEDMGFIMRDNQVQGTGVFDEFPTYDEWIAHFDLDAFQPNMFVMQDWHFARLPVWVRGNAYFNGAVSWAHEDEKFVGGDGAYARLVEKDGKLYLDSNVFDLLGGWTTDLIDSDTLGEAFEPEQRFENPDGSTIFFDTDFNGNHRSLGAMPGPFADADAARGELGPA